MSDLNRDIEPGDVGTDEATRAGHLVDDLLLRAVQVSDAYGLSLDERTRDARQRWAELAEGATRFSIIASARLLYGDDEPADALERFAGSSKFEGEHDRLLAAALLSIRNAGVADDEIRSVDGQVAQIGRWLVFESEQGFITTEELDSPDSASLRMSALVVELDIAGELDEEAR